MKTRLQFFANKTPTLCNTWGKMLRLEVQFYCSSSLLLLLLAALPRLRLLYEGFPLRMSGIDNSYKIDGDVLLVIHASIPPGVERPTLPRGRQMPVRRRPYDPTTIAARYYYQHHHHHYYTTQ